jgi:hypothetical protein
MQRTLFVVPELPGKSAISIPAMLIARSEEFRTSRKRAGVSVERVYSMATPMGTFVTAYFEADKPFGEIVKTMQSSNLPIDRDFLRMIGEVHGFDPKVLADNPPPEILQAWEDPDVRERRRGMAFAVPLIPGRTDAGRAFIKTAIQDRVKEHTASRRAFGVSREIIALNQTPMGDMVCVYIEGHQPAAGNAAFATSKTPYDLWFKSQLKTLFPPQIDFDKPVAPVAEIWDWVA